MLYMDLRLRRPLPPTWLAFLSELEEVARDHDTGVLITVDEVHY